MGAPLPSPDAPRCGCDEVAAGLMPVDEALRRGLTLAPPVPEVEVLPLSAATGRLLAHDIRTHGPLPPFDSAAMDGYALRLADLTSDGPWQLPLAGVVRAGDAPAPMPWGAALRILTGAPVPFGCDCVVAQEAVVAGAGGIGLTRRPAAGTNIRRAGDDLEAGALVLPAGRIIGAREAAALAAAGQGHVPVRRRLRVSLFTTGSELVAPGDALAPGQIWDANRALLLAALARTWIDLTDLGTVADDPAALAAALQRATSADIVLTTGGVSVGDEDHMSRLLTEAGGEVVASRLAMKPGKPTTIGRLGRAIWLGLPGNPVAAFVAWHVIGFPIAAARAGRAAPASQWLLAHPTAPLTRRSGRCEYRPARLVGHAGTGVPIVELLAPDFSHRPALLASADGLALIPAEADRLGPRDLITFLPFDRPA